MENYHRHSDYSQLFTRADSAAFNKEYAERAVELGHHIISSVEHGWQGYYFETFELAKKYNLKFVFGTEAYWVKDRFQNDSTNSHIIILAKNENGRRKINDILSTANEQGYYYKPRIDLDLLMRLPEDDVFLTSACTAFWKYYDIENIVEQLHDKFKSNFMLEIQNHATQDQIELNKRIKGLSNKYGIEMIAGLDSHYIYQEQSSLRDYILEAKGIHYEDEEGWYMDYPDDATVKNRFLHQQVFTEQEVDRAMNNADICCEFDDYDKVRVFTTDIKLPCSYPGKTQEERNKIYSRLITKKFKEYMKDIPPEEYDMYLEGVRNEVNVYKNTGMVDYPLIDYRIVQRAIEKGGIITNSGRGSAVGFITNTLCGFSKVDRFKSPIKLYPERFISESRILETKSLPDLDMNVGNQDIFAEAQDEIMTEICGTSGHAYPMIAFGKFKRKSAFKLYARAKKMDFDLANSISAQIDKYEEALKFASDDEKDEVDIYDYIDQKYHPYIKQSEFYWGIISDRKKAPCAYLIYDGNIREEIGLIKCKSESSNKEFITTVVDGAIAEKYKFLKNDLLIVDVVVLIQKIFDRIGMKPLTVNELTKEIDGDQKVWDLYAKGYTIGLNQCEKESTTKKMMRYKAKNISELTAFIAAIRPAFKSMYSKFESREPFDYGIPVFDNIIQTPQFPYSFILYQEQTMNVLNYAGFPLDECYGIIKAIAKKHPEKVKPLKQRFIDGFKEKLLQEDDMTNEKASEMSTNVWQIISDSCGYGFNSAHAYCMALDSLYNAWQKAHYPYEFYEIMLQHYSDKGNKNKVALIKREMKKAFGITEGEYKYGYDNRSFKLDKENHCIYPSLVSLKGMSQICANDLYEISQNNNFTNFVEVLDEMKNYKSIDAEKMFTLIHIDYFSQFGDINKLDFIYRQYKVLTKRSTIKKGELKKFYLTEEDVRPFAEKETNRRIDEINCVKWLLDHDHDHDDITKLLKYKYVKKEDGSKEKIPGELSTKKVIKAYDISEDEQKKYATKIIDGEFGSINMSEMLKNYLNKLKYKKTSIVEKIRYQQEIFGEIKLTIPTLDDSYYYVQNIDGKYSNKFVSLYQLNSGEQITVKVKGATLEKNPLAENNIIHALSIEEEAKWGRTPDKQWYRKDETELILKKYGLVR